MKKIIFLLLSILLMTIIFVSCKSREGDPGLPPEDTTYNTNHDTSDNTSDNTSYDTSDDTSIDTIETIDPDADKRTQ